MTNTDADLARLAARHFNDLQGLRTALAGVLLVLVSVAWMWTASETITIVVLLGAILAAVYPMLRLERYYAEHFGRVVQRDQVYRTAIVLVAITGAAFDNRSSVLVQVTWLLWAAYALWFAFDGWPYRWHQLFVVAAAMCAAALALQHPGSRDMGPGFLLVGFACSVSGVADHLLLLRAMRHTPGADAAREDNRARA